MTLLQESGPSANNGLPFELAECEETDDQNFWSSVLNSSSLPGEMLMYKHSLPDTDLQPEHFASSPYSSAPPVDPSAEDNAPQPEAVPRKMPLPLMQISEEQPTLAETTSLQPRATSNRPSSPDTSNAGLRMSPTGVRLPSLPSHHQSSATTVLVAICRQSFE